MESDGKKYSGKPVPYVARLDHDLNTVAQGLPPGVSVRVELTMSPNKVVLMTESADAEEYKINIVKV